VITTREAKRPRQLTFRGLRTRQLAVINGTPECPDCQVPMGLCQPDRHYPQRMIASCDHCLLWFYLDGGSDRGVELPAPTSEAEYPDEAVA
jgi:hypothetical protein